MSTHIYDSFPFKQHGGDKYKGAHRMRIVTTRPSLTWGEATRGVGGSHRAGVLGQAKN